MTSSFQSIRKIKINYHTPLILSLLYGLFIYLSACSSDMDVEEPEAPEIPEQQHPAISNHFTVPPIPIDKIAWISCQGDNGKIMPIGHTYWNSCGDFEMIPNLDRPCTREMLEIVSPGDAEVFAIEPGPDGCISFIVNPSFYWGFCHVTPAPGLKEGEKVVAGQKVATMFTDFAFDFGVINYHIENDFIDNDRYNPPVRHSQHPIDQYSGTMRSQLISLLPGNTQDLGETSFDQDGTASGGWFLEGAPAGTAVFEPGGGQYQLYLGPLVQNRSTQLMNIENFWEGMQGIGRSLFVDEGGVKWENITPNQGKVQQIMWGENFTNGTPDLSKPLGSVLIEMLDNRTLQIEWFDTHNILSDFTEKSRRYTR